MSIGALGQPVDANSGVHPVTSDDQDRRFDKICSGPRGYYTFDYNGIYELYGGSREFVDGLRLSPNFVATFVHGVDDHTPMNRPFSDKYVWTGYEYDINGTQIELDRVDGCGYGSMKGIKYLELATGTGNIEKGVWQNNPEEIELLGAQGLWRIPNMKNIPGENKLELSIDYGYPFKDYDEYLAHAKVADLSTMCVAERGGWYNETTKQGEMLGMLSASFTHPIDYNNQPYAGAARACYVTYTGKYKD